MRKERPGYLRDEYDKSVMSRGYGMAKAGSMISEMFRKLFGIQYETRYIVTRQPSIPIHKAQYCVPEKRRVGA